MNKRTVSRVIQALFLASLMYPALAQEVSIPDPGLNAAIREALQKPDGPLTELDFRGLSDLDANRRNVSSLEGLEAARNLVFLDLQINRLTNFSLPGGLTNLISLNVSVNPLTNFSLPNGLTNLDTLVLESAGLSNLTLPADLTGLRNLDLSENQFTSFNQLSNLTSLGFLDLGFNSFTNFSVPGGLTNLAKLTISGNPLTDISLSADLPSLSTLNLSQNQLTRFTLPAGLTNLSLLNLFFNQLTNLSLPDDLNRLETLNLGGNQLTSLTLPAGLTNLTGLFVTGNQLTTLTLPPDMTQLIEFGFLGNPLTTLVLPESLAAANLAEDVATLQNQGVSVFTYPLEVRLLRPRQLVGAFQFAITGPPGVYAVLGSADLADWSALGAVTNSLGSISFTDVTAHLSPQRFYRALLQSPPPNMVFIAPNTFTMGSPANEQDRDVNEGPQTTVTLTRGFWIGKYAPGSEAPVPSRSHF